MTCYAQRFSSDVEDKASFGAGYEWSDNHFQLFGRSLWDVHGEVLTVLCLTVLSLTLLYFPVMTFTPLGLTLLYVRSHSAVLSCTVLLTLNMTIIHSAHSLCCLYTHALYTHWLCAHTCALTHSALTYSVLDDREDSSKISASTLLQLKQWLQWASYRQTSG